MCRLSPSGEQSYRLHPVARGMRRFCHSATHGSQHSQLNAGMTIMLSENGGFWWSPRCHWTAMLDSLPSYTLSTMNFTSLPIASVRSFRKWCTSCRQRNINYAEVWTDAFEMKFEKEIVASPFLWMAWKKSNLRRHSHQQWAHAICGGSSHWGMSRIHQPRLQEERGVPNVSGDGAPLAHGMCQHTVVWMYPPSFSTGSSPAFVGRASEARMDCKDRKAKEEVQRGMFS